MAANILHSDQATRMSVYVIRAFVRLREELTANAAILKRLAEIDPSLPIIALGDTIPRVCFPCIS